MSVLGMAKRLSIATGLYRPARWLARRARPDQMRLLTQDVGFFRSILARGALCFDVGANIGEKSEALLLAGARVVAFEPNPLVLPELRARCGRRGEWTLVQTALGSGASIATLYAREQHGQSSLAPDWAGAVIGRYHVPVVTLDSAVQHFGRPAYCKIDVEGWELEVLKGLTQAIPLLSFEFHLTDGRVSKTMECLKHLRRFGPSEVNVTPAETSELHFAEWVALDEFLAWFPGDLKQTLLGKHGSEYGDMFVRNSSA